MGFREKIHTAVEFATLALATYSDSQFSAHVRELYQPAQILVFKQGAGRRFGWGREMRLTLHRNDGKTIKVVRTLAHYMSQFFKYNCFQTVITYTVISKSGAFATKFALPGAWDWPRVSVHLLAPQVKNG
jgi:hypothetical protein